MKNAFITICVLALAALFIAGCAGGQKQQTSSSKTFIGGTNALVMKFMTNSPPAEIFDKPTGGKLSPFDIDVEIENVGESDITANGLKLTLSGLSVGDYVSTKTPTTPIAFEVKPLLAAGTTLLGKSKGGQDEVIAGGKIWSGIVWEGLAYDKELKGTLPDIPIEVKACYQYTTKAVGLYCLKKDPLTTEKGVCDVAGSKTISNSGAPVQITEFSESAAGRSSILFTFKIKNLGTGELSKPAVPIGEAKCSAQYSDMNKVYVQVISGMANALSCAGLVSSEVKENGVVVGYATIDDTNNEGAFSCRLNTDTASSSAVKDLNIVLTYDYSEKITSKITIRHLLS